jgi:hypothetical protein
MQPQYGDDVDVGVVADARADTDTASWLALAPFPRSSRTNTRHGVTLKCCRHIIIIIGGGGGGGAISPRIRVRGY